MVLTSYKPRHQTGAVYVFDSERPGNYGSGEKEKHAINDFNRKQERKIEILEDINNLDIFKPESRDYIAGLIARNLIEQRKKENIRERRRRAR